MTTVMTMSIEGSRESVSIEKFESFVSIIMDPTMIFSWTSQRSKVRSNAIPDNRPMNSETVPTKLQTLPLIVAFYK